MLRTSRFVTCLGGMALQGPFGRRMIVKTIVTTFDSNLSYENQTYPQSNCYMCSLKVRFWLNLRILRQEVKLTGMQSEPWLSYRALPLRLMVRMSSRTRRFNSFCGALLGLASFAKPTNLMSK